MAICTVSEDETRLDNLPSAILASIMTKLDVASICSFAVTCKAFNACASQMLSFIPNFYLLDVAISADLLRRLFPPNPYLRILKIDCGRLDDLSIELLLRPSLHELYLQNCEDFSGKLLSEIGGRCKDLRSLFLGSVAGKRGRAIHVSDLEELLSGCTQLESLSLMFDVSIFLRHNFARAWATASRNLTTLEIGYVSSVMVVELLSPGVVLHQSSSQLQSSVLPSIQKLCLSVDYITDTLVGTISKSLVCLTHLDLRDAPLIEPTSTIDLTNSGLQQINQHGKLKHLSLIRSQEYLLTFFRRVNDLGVLLMVDKCLDIESISLGGFCCVTDAAFRTILHSCSKLNKLRVCHGTNLTDLVFHDFSATSLSLTNISLRRCRLLTDLSVAHLSCNVNLKVLDLRHCRNLGDESLKSISCLHKLEILLLDGSDISDTGLRNLGHEVLSSLVSLSLRGCSRLTDECINTLFDGSSGRALQDLDLSNLHNLSDNGILRLAKTGIPIVELRLRECHQISDTTIVALASMQVDDGGWRGSKLRLLDLYECRSISQLAFRWLKKPYFPRLRWLGLTLISNRDIVDALARNRPFLHVSYRGEELGSSHWGDGFEGLERYDPEEVDELEQWLLEGETDSDDEEMLEDEYYHPDIEEAGQLLEQ